MARPPAISGRKADHLDLCIDGDVAFRSSNLLDEVGLVHDALPELALDAVDLAVDFAGKRLRAPLLIAAMTGGVDRAERINRDLARVAQELGIGFAFGSQRPLLEEGVTAGYQVRDVAPDALLIGNIGAVQAARHPPEAIRERLVEACGLDALAVHLNPAQELVQPEGDRDFRGALEAIARLVEALDVPVVVKETGAGLSRSVGRRLVEAGVRWVDTSGAGGTSWVAVEAARADAPAAERAGRLFREWGIPTAASVAQLSGLGLGVCATGGLADGLSVARALALGARCGGIARAFLQAHAAGGHAGALALGRAVVAEIRMACLLTGSRTPADLARKPLVVGPRLLPWIPADAPLRRRIGP